jgi:hypothetical protein
VLLAWLITLPKLGPLPQSLHFIDISTPHPYKNLHKGSSLTKSLLFRTSFINVMGGQGDMRGADLVAVSR